MSQTSERPILLNLCLTSSNDWSTALEIPSNMLPVFCLKPRKWLDYLGYALTGSDGTLSLSSETPADLCDLDLPIAPGEAFFFHTSGSVAYVDPDLVTTDSSHSSTARETGFWDALLARDGLCPFSSVQPSLCDATHLLPHAKGNEYIELLTRKRTEGRLVIAEIDDPRNGILVGRGLHGWMGTGVLGFLQTPIRSLKSSDIHEGAEPDAYCLTIHVFLENSNSRQSLYHDKVASLRSPLPANWPSEVIFTALYASAALRAWGKEDFKTRLASITRMDYYPNALQDKSARDEAKKIRREERMKRKQQEHREPDGQDAIMALWSIFHDKAMERAKETAESESRQCSTDKVTSWLNGP
ncbi:hypothetical protein DFH11DRAFT_186125 [Phellopilus nigrolimitatus]|nr:hypothetical protein DFH11DRAFT_186125 [Phellopilus nigrolimitatus]